MNRFLSTLLTSLALGSAARADFITGTVVDAQGQPVAGVNIKAKSLTGGGNGNLMNGGTNAAGVFFSTIDPGTYDITFEPPPPPAAVALVKTLQAVPVAGTVNLGTVALDAAVHLQGRCLQTNGLPVQGVNLDVIELSTGTDLDLVGDTTNVAGEIHLAVPSGALEVRFKPSPILPPLLAPTFLEVDSSVAPDLGDVTLEPGFTVSAVAVTPSFVGIQNLDLDVFDSLTGAKLFTPGDNTDVNGFVDIVVAAGTYDVAFCPPNGTSFIAHLEAGVPVTGTTNLGLFTFQTGVHLTGTVTRAGGLPVASTNISAHLTSTGAKVLLCGNNSNASGDYDVVVPTGTLDLTFTPPGSEKLGSMQVAGLSVLGNTVQNALLPFCDCGQPTGAGTAGTGGVVPTLVATGGAARLGSHGWTVQVAGGRGAAPGILAVGFGPSCGSGLAGTISPMGGFGLVSRVHAVPFRLDGVAGMAGAGSADLQFNLPADLTLVGSFLSARAHVRDPGTGSGVALTPTVCGVLCQ